MLVPAPTYVKSAFRMLSPCTYRRNGASSWPGVCTHRRFRGKMHSSCDPCFLSSFILSQFQKHNPLLPRCSLFQSLSSLLAAPSVRHPPYRFCGIFAHRRPPHRTRAVPAGAHVHRHLAHLPRHPRRHHILGAALIASVTTNPRRRS